MRSIRPRESRLVVITLTSAGLLCLYVYGLEPRISQGLELHKQVNEIEMKLAEFRTLIVHREEIQSQSERLRQPINSEGNKDTGLKSLLEEIQRLADAAQLVTISYQPQKIRELGFYRLLGVAMTAEGSIRDVVRFLHSLGESSQLLRVDQLQINALPKPGQLRGEFYIVKIIAPQGVS